MSGRPHRAYSVLATLLYGRHPWLQRAPGGWVSVEPQAASRGLCIRSSRLRVALLKLRSLELILAFRAYRGRWDVQLAPPLLETAPRTPQTETLEAETCLP